MMDVHRQRCRSRKRPTLKNAACTASMVLALMFPVSAMAQQSADETLAPGRRPVVPELFLRTGEAVATCLSNQPQWINFCNGLVQAYAEYVVLQGKACIPVSTTRRELVAVFAGPDVVVSTGYIDDMPAFDTAVEMFMRHFPCD